MSGNSARRPCLTSSPEDVTCADKFNFIWTVQKFYENSDLTSPVFHGGPRNNHSWVLKLNPKSNIEGVECLSLYLELVAFGHGEDSRNRTVDTHFTLSFLNADRTSIRPCINFHEFKKSGFALGGVISLENLHSPELRIVADDSFKVLCEIGTYGGQDGQVQSVETGSPAKIIPSDKVFKIRLAPDFGKLFKDSIGTDITIKTETGQTFKAHKAILMARSPVFAAMFNDTTKSDDGTLEIKDFKDEEVKGMLEHAYTNQTDCLPMRASELLKIFDKYGLAELKEDCEFARADALTKDNVALALLLAYKFNAPFLKQKAIDFIQADMGELLKLKSFQDTMKAHADNKIYAEMLFS